MSHLLDEDTPIGVVRYSAELPSLPRLIRRSELRQVVPLGDTTIYELEQRGEFPRRIVLTPKVVVWKLSEVETWIEQRRRDTDSGRVKANEITSRKRRPRRSGA